MHCDERALEITTDNAEAVILYDKAVSGYLTIARDTMALLEAALDAGVVRIAGGVA